MKAPIGQVMATVVFATALTAAAPAAMAQDSAAGKAREMSNPTAAVAAMNSFVDFTSYKGDLPGAKDQSSVGYVFQPGLPFPQANGANILFRPAIPLLFNQPVFEGSSFESSGFNLGNIGYDLAYGRTYSNGLLLLGGLVGTIPSATDKKLRGEWAFGPEALAGVIKKWGVLGALLNASWDVSGNDKGSRVAGQYFYALSLPRAMQFSASPPFIYDLDSEEFTLPVGGGLAKTIITASGMPWKFSAQFWYYASQPDAFGPEWQLRLQISPVLKLPWG